MSAYIQRAILREMRKGRRIYPPIDEERVKSAKLWLERMAKGRPTQSVSDIALARHYGSYLCAFFERLPSKEQHALKDLLPLVQRRFPVVAEIFIKEVKGHD